MEAIYKKGRRKEYQIVADERKKGRITFRSAGSHSPIDVISIDTNKRIILLIQSKRVLSETMKAINPKLKKKLEADNEMLNGMYYVGFEVR